MTITQFVDTLADKYSRLSSLEANNDVMGTYLNTLLSEIVKAPNSNDYEYVRKTVSSFYERCGIPSGALLGSFDLYMVGSMLRVCAVFTKITQYNQEEIKYNVDFKVDLPRGIAIKRKTDERQTWQDFFMDIARKAASRTTCASGRSVGAVFVKDKNPVISSFNGVPPKYPHPTECRRVREGCKSGEGLDMCPCNHAEANAIAIASRNGISLQDSTLYVTTRPCVMCMGMLAVSGVKRVIYDTEYSHELSTEIAKCANIELIDLNAAKLYDLM